MSTGRWPDIVSTRKSIAVVFFVSLLTALAAAWGLGRNEDFGPSSDYRSVYRPSAESLVEGRGYSIRGRALSGPPPGYPLALAGAFRVGRLVGLSEDAAAALLNIVTFAAGAALLASSAGRVFGGRAGFLAGCLWATYPLALRLVPSLGSEMLFCLLLFGAFEMLRRCLGDSPSSPWKALGLGVLAGAAMLVRPIAIGLGVVFALLAGALDRDRPLRTRLVLGLCILAGNLLAVLPWSAWVYGHSGRLVLLSDHGTASVRDGLTYGIAKDYRREMAVPGEVRGLMQRTLEAAERGDIDSMSALAGFMTGELRHDPVAWAKLMGLKLVRSWYGTDRGAHDALSFWIQAVYLVVIALGAAAAWKGGRDQRRWTIAVVTVACYFWLMTFAVLSIVRYMVPAMGLLMTLAPGARARFGRA